MKESANNSPLNKIFKLSKEGKPTEEIESMDEIDSFFKFIKDEKTPGAISSKVIEELIGKFKKNRYLCEYFSTYEQHSIYIFLIKLYMSKSASPQLKTSIINLINELRINLDINKDVYDFLFQKIAAVYREEEKASTDALYDYLNILDTFFGETINGLKPRNYFCCSGEGCFEIDLSQDKINLECTFTFILNFKIGKSTISEENVEKGTISNLISINFSNGYTLDFDLKYPSCLIVKEIQENFIKVLPDNEWVNLIINIVNDDKNISVFFFANGENRLIPFPLKNPHITPNEIITSIQFFNNFYGEVSSISFLSQKEYGYPGVNASQFLKEFNQYKEGLWKKKKIENFLKILSDFDSVGKEKPKSKTILMRKMTKKEPSGNVEKEADKKLINNLVFCFTPLNCLDEENNIVENIMGRLNIKYVGNIRPHRYQCFQKKLANIGVIPDLLPIAEMFIIQPQLLNGNNLEIFLKIIKDILSNRKYNMKFFVESNFFQIFSLFLEKYPKNLFTEKILDMFTDIGKCMFGNNIESLSSIYFDNILLNEKILSKYSQDLQIKFWNHILLFCQSDSSQIEVFINMNRICLILRFYDKNKYTEMCCQRHLSMIKEEYRGSKMIMNPPMDKKLQCIENIMNVIINSQEPEKAFDLFKLLTLDLSPCLTEFIVNIFIKAFQKNTNDNKWKDNLINVFVDNKFETIIANTFVHSLPEIKLSLLKLMFEINFRLSKSNKIDRFKPLEKAIRTILLPQDNFYSKEMKINQTPANSAVNKVCTMNENSSSEILKNLKSGGELKDSLKKSHFANNTGNKVKMLDPNAYPILKGIKNEEKTDKGKIHPPMQLSQNNKVSSMISKLEGLKFKLPGMNPINAKPAPAKAKESPTPNQTNNKNKETKEEKKEGKKEEKKEDDETANYNLLLKNEDDEHIIFQDKIYYDYVENVYRLLLLWSLNLPSDFDFTKVDLKTTMIESRNALEFLLEMVLEINDSRFTLKCIKNYEKLSELPQNAYRIMENERIIAYLIDIAYQYYRSTDKIEEKCYNVIKNILFNCYLNSMDFLEKTHSLYPCDKIETLLLWGDKIIFNEKGRSGKEKLFDFLIELLIEILTGFKIRFDPKMEFNSSKGKFNCNPGSNFYLKNYLILMTHLFRYTFNYKHDQIIKTEGITFISPSPKVNNFLVAYITGMKMDPLKGMKINEQWVDYPFFNDLYQRVNGFWQKIKNFNSEKMKGKSKVVKYEQILDKIILDKHNKNLYQKEIEVLCYEELIGEKEQIIPSIKIIPIGLMCLIHSSETESDYLYWLKELKKFTRFLIIASSNLIRTNQLEFYLDIQEKCANSLIACICFFKDILETSTKCQEKIQKNLMAILLFCAIIVKYQYNYINKHKGIKKIKLTGKPSRNDLTQSAVFTIFAELIKNENNVPLWDQNELESLAADQYKRCIDLLDTKEWKEAFLENDAIRERINNGFFCINNYKKIVENRVKQIKNITSEKNEKYKDDILLLLPLYEKELLKYSNNSLEKNKKIKNIYKRFKKASFTWNGNWSDRNLFFQDSDKLKLKLMNHMTKTLMKPLLTPIIDISYYLPEFSGFNPATLFNPNNEEGPAEKFKLIMDIDKILKSSEKSNIKEIKKRISGNYEENFLRNIYIKSNPELEESLTNIANNLDFGKEEEFAIIQKDSSKAKSDDKKYYLSCLVKSSHHIKGVCFIDNKYLNFKVFLNQKTGNAMSGIEIGFTTDDDDYDKERETCFGSYFVCHPKDKDIYKISIKYTDIKWIFRRRYYYKNSALEIFTTANKTFYFNFKIEKEREDVINEIVSKLNEPAKIIDDLKDPKDAFDNIIGYENVSVTDSKKKGVKKKKLSHKIESWKEWKITNFELLMWLNIYGNRSYNDISQYPVFPWVLNTYQDPLKSDKADQKKYDLRDMSLPMGMMALDEKGEQRKELFLLNYETLKENDDESMKPYFYGSNYSNPIYVCNYLMRIFPFTHIAIELQGSKFDQPDRLFISVEKAFNNSVTQKTDVRELIPEFYYLPEIFLNINDLNMGKLENGDIVNDIETPCYNNPYEFVLTMKTILESDELSNSIQNWVDLIFGSKAKGKEAENAKNLFSEASYQETIDIKKIENKESYLRMVEFGLIPNQIMNKDCSKREKKEDILKGKEITDPGASLMTYDCKPIKEQAIFSGSKENIKVLMAGVFSSEKITLVLNINVLLEKKISCSMFDKGYNDDLVNTVELENIPNKMGEFYSHNSSKNAMQFFNKGKILIMGGFYDGKIVIYHVEQKSQEIIIPFNDECPILSVCISKDEEYLLVGNSIGNVALYKIDIDIKKWSLIKKITSQKREISHIHCNSDLNLWVSTTIDGFINLYTLPLCKLARTIKVSTKKCSYSFLTSAPLPSIVIINDEANSELNVYSINGKVISKKELYSKLECPIIIKDLNSNEYLGYIGKDHICIHNLPLLEVVFNINVAPNLGISTIFTSEDNKYLYCLNKSGSEVYIIRDEFKKNLRNASLIMA